MDIAKSLELKTLQESDDERTCGDKLFSYLKNRNCLLLLDGIWEHLDLQLLGMAHSATKQGQQQQPRKAVVFTTLSETLCGRMKAEKKIKVKCLDPNHAWQLFKENSDGDRMFSAQIQESTPVLKNLLKNVQVFRSLLSPLLGPC
ncbi:hypothetical protein ZIOFF_033363 [Zingiber officinale]|uniref:NB-ARC domain-containing protein n=1 Tax=Zingiber officinale TaxID=94328 RepID=A0A8J5GQ75_ZINOF|nr:hypothetical protein ZIOFF_033363 [Zingiber officinale]